MAKRSQRLLRNNKVTSVTLLCIPRHCKQNRITPNSVTKKEDSDERSHCKRPHKTHLGGA
jgi:hypothetical protein